MSAPATTPPRPNGVVECLNQSLKYERLYRLDISDGQALADDVEELPPGVQRHPAARVVGLGASARPLPRDTDQLCAK